MKTSEPILGIDLGSCGCRAAICTGEQVEMLLDERGEKSQASTVTFLRNGEIRAGNEALLWQRSCPRQTIHSIKRMLGRRFANPAVQALRGTLPYQIVEGPAQTVRVKVFHETYSLELILGLLLKQVRSLARWRTGEWIERAALAVPAGFSAAARQLVEEAARLAGFAEIELVEEPLAVAHGYGMAQGGDANVAVLDVGASGFRFSLIRIEKGEADLIATREDDQLGSARLDRAILDYLVERIPRGSGGDLREDPWQLRELLRWVERIKLSLSYQDQVEVSIPMVGLDRSAFARELPVRLDSTQLAKLASGFVQQLFGVCDETLGRVELAANDIDSVILTGGSTRLPVIVDSVRYYFSKEPLTFLDPEEVVALGAARLASRGDLGHESPALSLLRKLGIAAPGLCASR